MPVYQNVHELLTNVIQILKKCDNYESALKKISKLKIKNSNIGRNKAKKIMAIYVNDFIYLKENTFNSGNNEQKYSKLKKNLLEI